MEPNPGPNGASTPGVYEAAVGIVRLLSAAEGRCLPRAEMQVELGYSRSVIQEALTYLEERGALISYHAVGRCRSVRLHPVDWRRLNLGELVDAGLLPDDERDLLAFSIKSSGYRGQRHGNPSRYQRAATTVRAAGLARRLSNP